MQSMLLTMCRVAMSLALAVTIRATISFPSRTLAIDASIDIAPRFTRILSCLKVSLRINKRRECRKIVDVLSSGHTVSTLLESKLANSRLVTTRRVDVSCATFFHSDRNRIGPSSGLLIGN